MKSLTINWHDLKDKQYLYLKSDVLQDLVNKGIKKAGTLQKLCKKMNTTSFYQKLRINGGITIHKLKELLDYIEIEYPFVNGKIQEIRMGDLTSINNPKFPIRLSYFKIGSILGHLVSDGCLYYDNSRKDYIRTSYYSPDKESIDQFIKNINSIFGKVHFNKEKLRNCFKIRTGCDIVGKSLKKSGGIVGKKYIENKRSPWLVRQGSYKCKKEYLSAVFDDEASVGKSPFPYIILQRSIHIKLDKNERMIINRYVKPQMKTNKFPTGHVNKTIAIRKLNLILKKQSKVLLDRINSHKPKLLKDESCLLKKDFDIDNFLYIIGFSITQNKRYSISCCLVIRRKKDVIKFYKNIKFSLKRKQESLKNALLYSKWLKNGI